ncbi:hypothetical protein EV1_028688 [Malus domestica]
MHHACEAGKLSRSFYLDGLEVLYGYCEQFVCRPPCVIVFRHITAPMLADEEDKISVLALMDLMAPDCDISVLDGLKYVSRFGIPLKKYWKT